MGTSTDILPASRFCSPVYMFQLFWPGKHLRAQWDASACSAHTLYIDRLIVSFWRRNSMPESAVSPYQKDPTVAFPDQSRGVRPVRSVCSCCSESLGLLHLYSASTVHKRTAFTSSHVKEISPSFINKKVCSTPSLPLSPSTLSSHHELTFQSNNRSEG